MYEGFCARVGEIIDPSGVREYYNLQPSWASADKRRAQEIPKLSAQAAGE